MATILTVSGSPSATSRTAALVAHAGHRLEAAGHRVHHLHVRELPPAALLAADTTHPAIRAATQTLAAADALVLGTPVFKAAYSGLLKSFLDLLPQTALAGKTVLPLVTGGTPAHVLVLDYALRPVLTSLAAERVLHGWFVLDQHLTRTPEAPSGQEIAAQSAGHVERAVDELLGALPDTARPRAEDLPHDTAPLSLAD